MTNLSNLNNLGRAKSRAHSDKMRGLPFNYIAPIRQARPAMPVGHQFMATPIEEEGVMLYSFATEEAVQDFVSLMPGAERI